MDLPWESDRCCICLARGGLTRAHLIPAFLGGTLVVPNECATCNHTLGSKVEAPLRLSPEVRLAVMNLGDELPDLEARISEGQQFFARDGAQVVRFAKRGAGFRLLNESGPAGRVVDDANGVRMIRACLERAGRPSDEIDAVIADWEEAPAGTEIQIGDETFRRRTIAAVEITYGGDGKLADERAAALIAYRALALALHPRLMLGSSLESVRAWFRDDGAQPATCRVEAKATNEYRPIHGLVIRSIGAEIKVRLCLFGWLVYDVWFPNPGAPFSGGVFELDLRTGVLIRRPLLSGDEPDADTAAAPDSTPSTPAN